jgi:ribose/xylose/arabinose/galactoside ABC-type transport system permease subunit
MASARRDSGIAWLRGTGPVLRVWHAIRVGSNLINIGNQSSILLLLALPMTLIIMTEGLDLSMGAVLGLSESFSPGFW